MNSSETVGRVLVLGGTGLIGAEVARTLLDRQTPVTVMARHRPASPLAGWLERAEFVLGQAEDPALLAKALEGVSHVVHALGCLAPARANDNPSEHHRMVVPTLLGLLDALVERPDVGLTYLSSGGAVYGNGCALPATEESACQPVSAYGVTKLTAEHHIGMYTTTHGIRAQILRVGNAYGPRQVAGTGQGVVATFLEAALSKGPVQVYGDGSSVRDYVEVSDVARAVVELHDRAEVPLVVNVGTGVGHSVRQVVETIQEVTGVHLGVEWMPSRRSDVDAVYLDTARLGGLIEWSPVSLAEGVAALVGARRPDPSDETPA